MKITIDINDNQYKVLMKALDLLSQLGAGQLSTLEELLTRDWELFANNSSIRKILDDLRSECFPDIVSNSGTYGINSFYTQEDSKIAYDLIQVLRYAVAYHNKPKKITVDFSPPIKYSKEPLAKVSIDDNKVKELLEIIQELIDTECTNCKFDYGKCSGEKCTYMKELEQRIEKIGD